MVVEGAQSPLRIWDRVHEHASTPSHFTFLVEHVAEHHIEMLTRKVYVRLPGKGNSNSHGARPVHLIISMIKLIRTNMLSIKDSLSLAGSRRWRWCASATPLRRATHFRCPPNTDTDLERERERERKRERGREGERGGGRDRARGRERERETETERETEREREGAT